MIVFKNFEKDNFKTFFYFNKSLLVIFGELRGFIYKSLPEVNICSSGELDCYPFSFGLNNSQLLARKILVLIF